MNLGRKFLVLVYFAPQGLVENPGLVQFPHPHPWGVGNRKNVQSQHVTEGQRAMWGGTSEGWALACSGPALEVDYEVRGEEG